MRDSNLNLSSEWLWTKGCGSWFTMVEVTLLMSARWSWVLTLKGRVEVLTNLMDFSTVLIDGLKTLVKVPLGIMASCWW